MNKKKSVLNENHHLIGKSTNEIEIENGFVWYVEFKPKHYFGSDLGEHKELMEVFIKFLPSGEIRILKLNDEKVDDVFEMSYEEVLESLELLGDKRGRFYDDECEISYSILTDDLFATVHENMIFWSSEKELAEKWSDALGEAGLQVYEMDYVGGGRKKFKD